MSEIIRISNFGGIKEMEMELKPINVIIGPQASGKSVTAKLLYFFKSFFNEIYKSSGAGESKREFDNKQIEQFKNYFPKNTWPDDSFEIEYITNNTFIKVTKSTTTLKLKYSNDINTVIDKGIKFYKNKQKNIKRILESRNILITSVSLDEVYEYIKEQLNNKVGSTTTFDQLFIPAGRSFFSNIQSSIFTLLRENNAIDPFIIEFGSYYEDYKNFAFYRMDSGKDKTESSFDTLISDILNGNYLKEKDKDYLIHKDQRKVNLLYASSGQQETLPVLLVLKSLTQLLFRGGGLTLYIEEPEAHLFPIAQKRIVQLLARTFNTRDRNFQIIVTTHSPYILTAFNNLMEAGKILDEKEGLAEELSSIIPKEEIISPDSVAAYSLANGEKTDLIDGSTKLISQNILDSVSDEIAIEFGKLLDLEF